MRYILTLLLLGAFSLPAYSFSKAQLKTMKAVEKEAKRVQVPADLLTAICLVESNLNPLDYTYKDGGEYGSAIGMCQILTSNAESMGYTGDCNGDFRNISTRTEKNCSLFSPYTNSYWAGKLLKKLLVKYDNNWTKAIAAYNAGSVQVCTTGKVYSRNPSHKLLYRCKKGGLLNQQYVDKVYKALDELYSENVIPEKPLPGRLIEFPDAPTKPSMKKN